MFISYFTERPYQDEQGEYINTLDLAKSNADYNPVLGGDLYHRYLDEKVYAEEMGFDGLVLNEHHSMPACMGGVINVEASILARITKRARIVLAGNVLPIWDDPLWLAETLAMIDVISRGRLVCGWVRGTGRESVTHNTPSPYNWERYQEAHDLIMKAWTEPGPFRWESEHFDYRYVNPWPRPLQQPPPIWIPGSLSKATVKWAAERQFPYLMLATEHEPTKRSFEYYDACAREAGHETGSQHRGYLFKVHVDETEELAEQTARKFLQGPSNPFLEGNQGQVRGFMQNLPGMNSRTEVLPTIETWAPAVARGAQRQHKKILEKKKMAKGKDRDYSGSYEEQIAKYTIIAGTPDQVVEKIRNVLEYLRPGIIAIWDGDGAMSHEDTMRALRLLGEEVLPRVREIGKELDLHSPFEVSPVTNKPVAEAVGVG